MTSQIIFQIQPCPFLDKFSPAELVGKFVQRQADNLSLYPIWLNNDGQNVIGFLPKMAWLVTPNNSQTNVINIEQSQRQPLCFTENCYSQQNFPHQSLNLAITDLQQRLIAYETNQSLTQSLNQSANLDNFPKTVQQNYYQNGLIGVISYDISAQHLANISPHSPNSPTAPLAYFGHYDCYLTLQEGHWQLHTVTAETVAKADIIINGLKTLLYNQTLAKLAPLILQPRWQYGDYQTAFAKVQHYLYAGDCYQINLTQCWHGELVSGKLVDYLPNLQAATRAPFAGYMQLQHGAYQYELLSCSPELFLTFAKNRVGNNAGEITLTTKPIKGTRPRGDSRQHDERLKSDLASSDKDKAENVMIVDLLRNDLGKYAKTGSVNVPSLFTIETFSNVHHMVSTVTATLNDNVHPLTVLFDSLPAGSITGTPKQRAVEIIDELESGKRGAYCGTLGFLNFTGTGQWNVLIRTLQAISTHCTAQNQVTLWAGGGITVGSTCEAEYQECFDKVGNLLAILKG